MMRMHGVDSLTGDEKEAMQVSGMDRGKMNSIDLIYGILLGVSGFAALDRFVEKRYVVAMGWVIILGMAILFYVSPP